MLTATDLVKDFPSGQGTHRALNSVSLTVKPGDFLAVVGRSGSGKTTLLNVLSTLLRPDAGSISYQGRELTALSESERNNLRARDFSVVFQFHYLVPYLSALENVLLPFLGSFRPVTAQNREWGEECLAAVGLAGKAVSLPGKLSGGEQQRVAIARALVKRSRILFADELTGNLDKDTGAGIMDLLDRVSGQGVAVLMVTHDQEWAKRAHRTLTMADGILIEK